LFILVDQGLDFMGFILVNST